MSSTRQYLTAAILGTMSRDTERRLYHSTDFEFHEVNNPTLFDDHPDLGFATTKEMDDTLDFLVEQYLVEKLHDPYTSPDFVMTEKGRNHFYSQLGTTGALEARFHLRGERWLKEALTNIHLEERARGTRLSNTSRASAFGGLPNAEDVQDSAVQEIGLPLENILAPASDRYVSVKDNQPGFDELVARLSAIKDDYARDHNHLAVEPICDDLLSEIDGVLAQVQRGRVRLGELSNGLLPILSTACIALSAYPGFVQLIHDASAATQAILTFFGLS
ncbi:hypothetical protein F2P47_17180 [Parvibaculum sedimenti]|uniref:Uncharacterized protein n=1 Tax=Parvibaculum sedimenti TaxID=2608632 RepID=A0A6N6VDV8_9HYPH|nr:hypothetical protein [Parvibaculum sedimenti]KAB7738439.1 hypothetical protein F2P47_17180 [Parvibaculum sedimenti]